MGKFGIWDIVQISIFLVLQRKALYSAPAANHWIPVTFTRFRKVYVVLTNH